ncbi:MAG: threonine--tRNA ligase [Candidatus Aenigmatarchaeota archaeon]|nr:threonine--tRNA ligase [Candidatus Aenigmarchaeota archaeon]
MRIITLHSNSLVVEPKTKAMKDAEEISKKKQSFGESLVVFTAVEERDEAAPDAVAANAIESIKKIAGEVKTKTIVLYPYVHLTSTPSSAAIARKVLKLMEDGLKKEGFVADHAPFGWYKEFTINVKGHPLAELSREITAIPGVAKAEDVISGALKEEEKVKSEWFILEPSGRLTPADKFDFKKHPNLQKFYRYEVSKVRGVTSEPPHVKLMRSLELADFEPGSDPGNLRFYPKGRLIKSLLEQWVTNKVIKYGAMEVETPIMYDYEHPALKNYLNRFPARQYIVRSAKKDFFLRFSACFGQFLMNSSMTISYKNLPLKMYELTKYSFRLEKAGELVGLRRLRAFTMPDMHTLCADIEQAKKEFVNQFKLCMECMSELGYDTSDYETAIRFTEDFWNNNKEWLTGLVKLVKKPVLIERWNYRYAYFDPKFEFNVIDAMDKASALSTVQIDHENAERYGVQYTDADNKRKYPLILHCSPSGATERILYSLLETAWLKSKEGANAMLPLWLSPTQVRLCPMNDSLIPDCKKIADELAASCIRVDIDDRTESIQKKIRDAEMEWVPFIIVYGEKEKKSGKLAVRFRENGKVEQLSTKQLVELIQKQTTGFPFKPLPLSMFLSKRPSFV